MKKFSLFIQSLLVIGAIYLFFFLPIPFYLEVPGTAFGLDDMIEVDGSGSDLPGDFYITTVGIQQGTPFTILTSVLPFRDLVSERELFGDIENYEEYDVIQQYYMDSSINTAVQVAFDFANQPYELAYNGVYVLQVIETSSFAGVLKVGDTVKEVDGNAFSNSQDFIDHIADKEVGDSVHIAFERNGEMLEATGELIVLDSGAPGIGIGLVDNTSLETEPEVAIHSGEIGGPSAGLMFSLQIYEQLTEQNLRKDFDIAGTGTISAEGEVGRIGGIAKKIVAADELDVDYFFAPADEVDPTILALYPETKSNYEEALDAAEAIGTEMEIIPVKTFQDALDFLENLE